MSSTLWLKGSSGVLGAGEVVRAGSDCQWVVGSEHIHRALEAGARDYVLEESG